MKNNLSKEAYEIAKAIAENAKRRKKILAAEKPFAAIKVVEGYIVAECREKKLCLTTDEKVACNLAVRSMI